MDVSSPFRVFKQIWGVRFFGMKNHCEILMLRYCCWLLLVSLHFEMIITTFFLYLRKSVRLIGPFVTKGAVTTYKIELAYRSSSKRTELRKLGKL